jgi:hypothetical protein
MERNPWKLATIGMALVGTTALGTGLTTTYMLRPPAEAAAPETVALRTAEAPRAAPGLRHAVATRPAPPAAKSATTPTPAVTTAATSSSPPRVTPVSTAATAPADCATGGDRAMRIAKPGVIGALLGAGLGAAGGAIADGGEAAGKGALIGGLAGAALGGGYGAYKTQNECGTIFGGAFGSRPTAAPATGTSPATFDAADGQGITVYNAR